MHLPETARGQLPAPSSGVTHNAPAAAHPSGRPSRAKLRYMNLTAVIGDYLQLRTRAPPPGQHLLQRAWRSQRAHRYRHHRVAAMRPETGLPSGIHRQPRPGPPAQRTTGQFLDRYRNIEPGDPAQLLDHHLRLELPLHRRVDVLEIAATAATRTGHRALRRPP